MKTEVKIGLVGVISLVALYLGLNFLKGANLFSSSEVYYISFSNTKGLTKNSPVYADGYKVGVVSNIQYDYSHPGEVVVEISTDKGLRIPKGSTAQLDEALLGGCTLNMLLATNLREAFHPGDTIKGSDVSGLMQKVPFPAMRVASAAAFWVFQTAITPGSSAFCAALIRVPKSCPICSVRQCGSPARYATVKPFFTLISGHFFSR